MYYGAWQYEMGGGQINYPHPYYLCYAQSSDGKSWRKPSLGMVEFEGDRNINIVLAPQSLAGIDLSAGDTAIFRDANPAAEENAPYKALVPGRRPRVFGAPARRSRLFHPRRTQRHALSGHAGAGAGKRRRRPCTCWATPTWMR